MNWRDSIWVQDSVTRRRSRSGQRSVELPMKENIFEQLNTCNLITTMKIMLMFIHNLACNQQMSVNDDKQYTER